MRAVIYARYSCDNQREESIEGQLRECKEFATRKGFTLIGSYIDRAVSAKTDNRPEFQRKVKESASGQFDVVIVWELDRFARNRYDSAQYNGGYIPVGYKINEYKHYQIDELTAPFVKETFLMYASGKKVKEIVEYLGANDVVSSQGKPLTKRRSIRFCKTAST